MCVCIYIYILYIYKHLSIYLKDNLLRILYNHFKHQFQKTLKNSFLMHEIQTLKHPYHLPLEKARHTDRALQPSDQNQSATLIYSYSSTWIETWYIEGFCFSMLHSLLAARNPELMQVCQSFLIDFFTIVFFFIDFSNFIFCYIFR